MALRYWIASRRFRQLTEVSQMSEAALFEDMVEQPREEKLRTARRIK